jgi:hypothetical protein
MFEFAVQTPRHVRLRIGRLHLRTWRRHFMLLPKRYRDPEDVYAVEWDDEEDGGTRQLGVFFEEAAAKRCRERLEAEGWSNLRINVLSVHMSLGDWEFDR